MKFPHLRNEKKLFSKGYAAVAGIDEVGRGALAGPVVAAAVVVTRVLPKFHKETRRIIRDSKQLSPDVRQKAFEFLTSHFEYSYGIVENGVIDVIGINSAIQRAMDAAIFKLAARPDFVLTDGGTFSFPIPFQSHIKGDSSIFSVAAASIIAKVTRDRILQEVHKVFPNYKFYDNKGYGTAEHIRALRRFGPCKAHRKSFMPIKNMVI